MGGGTGTSEYLEVPNSQSDFLGSEIECDVCPEPAFYLMVDMDTSAKHVDPIPFCAECAMEQDRGFKWWSDQNWLPTPINEKPQEKLI